MEELRRTRMPFSRVMLEPHLTNGGFVPVRKKGSAADSGTRTRGQQSLRIVSRLKGAYRVDCTPFHLSNISLTSSVEDVITFCRLKRVTITGCYAIRTRRWGTQSMTIFVESSDADLVLSDDFWPHLVHCRRWMKTPPRGPRGSEVQRSDSPAEQWW